MHGALLEAVYAARQRLTRRKDHMMNDMIALLQNHRSIREYTKESVDEETIDLILRSAQRASTSSHFQAYTIIEVRSDEKKEVLYRASGNQPWILKAPLLLLFCGDLHRGRTYYEEVDPEVFSNTECYTVATIDCALAAQNAMIAAESMGLGGVFVGGIRNDVACIYAAFELPDGVFPLFVLCLGYPHQNPTIKPRLIQEQVHKIDTYTQKQDDERMECYNAIVSDYYQEREAEGLQETWTRHCGKLLASKSRDYLGAYLKSRGLLIR